MLKWLINKMSNHAYNNLCMKCNTSHRTADIVNPFIGFKKKTNILYHYGLTCLEVCGSFRNHQNMPLPHPKSLELYKKMGAFGIHCWGCRTSILTMSALAPEDFHIISVVSEMLSQELVCSTCLDAFVDNIHEISTEILSMITQIPPDLLIKLAR